MKKIIAALLLVVAIVSAAWRVGEKEIFVSKYYSKLSQIVKDNNLKCDFYPNGKARLYVIDQEISLLERSGIEYKIIKEDLKAFAENFWTSEVPSGYYTTAEITDLADSLSNAFPDLCQKYVFGATALGTELAALKITDNPDIDENEAEVMFDGGIHGDEVGGAENCIRFAREILQSYESDEYIKGLIDNREIWIYYSVNPDGRNAMTRENSQGVDCNRDWGYMWNGESGSSGAYSQNESKALRDCAYNRNFVVHTTYHSGTEFISHPWSYRSNTCPDHSHINQLAGLYASTSGYTNIPYGPGCTGMYPINGSSKDANYGAYGSISWSMEISMDKQPPSTQIQYYYNLNKPAMLTMIEYSGYGISGTITDETTGEPVKATIFVNDYFPCYNDLNNGDYHKYLLPGTYNILVKANGYDEKLVEGVVVTAENSTISDITLTPSENKNFAYKVVSCQIPDNNTADLGFTPNIIGEPDGNAYSIGKSGWIVFDMLNAVEDGPGPDISIVESDTPESFTLYIGETLDGPWHEVGTGTGTTAFDIASSGLPSSRFFKIKDNSSGSSNVLGAGFDFDGAIALEHSDGPYIVSMGYSIDDSTGNNDNRIDPGETVTINIDLKNGGNEVASNLLMNLSYESVFVTIDNTEFSLEQLNVDEEYSVSFQLTAEENTPPATIFNLALHIAVENSTNSFDYEYQFMIAGFLIEEYFTSFPPEGWAIEGGSNWCSGSSNNAGGTAPEAMFNWNPSTVGDQYLISPAINTNGKTKLFLEFKQMINYYGAGYELFLVSSSDKENWNVITEFENSASVPATTETIEITNSDVGSETFYVAWLFSGDSYQINYWYVDDVIMTGENGSGTEEGNIVENFELIGNYPNPFNPETNIRFINNISGKMEFTVFNSNGQLVYNDIKDLRSIGMNTIKFDGSSLNSGVYFYSIKMNSVEHYGKMMLLK